MFYRNLIVSRRAKCALKLRMVLFLCFHIYGVQSPVFPSIFPEPSLNILDAVEEHHCQSSRQMCTPNKADVISIFYIYRLQSPVFSFAFPESLFGFIGTMEEYRCQLPHPGVRAAWAWSYFPMLYVTCPRTARFCHASCLIQFPASFLAA